jgi:hypothetical protein
MPQKYRILSSHADAAPKSGTKTSNYPHSKKSVGGKSSYEKVEGKHEKTESKREKRGEKLMGQYK